MVRQHQYQLHRLLLDTNMAPAPPRIPYGGDTSFDGNMVIILAALLCALICALGLNSIVRCALRCGNRYVFENPDGVVVVGRLGVPTGVKKEALGQIPVVVYKAGVEEVLATDCPICLGEFGDGERVRVLPKCKHGFHVKCIDKWFESHSSCPTCRQLLLVEHPPSSNVT